MLSFASTSLGLFFWAITHSVQKRPWNQSLNVSTSSCLTGVGAGVVAAAGTSASAATMARSSASRAPTFVGARSRYGPAPAVPYRIRVRPSGVVMLFRKNQLPVLGSRRTGIVTALPWRPAVSTGRAYHPREIWCRATLAAGVRCCALAIDPLEPLPPIDEPAFRGAV